MGVRELKEIVHLGDTHTMEMRWDGMRVLSEAQPIVSLQVIAISDHGTSKSPEDGKLK